MFDLADVISVYEIALILMHGGWTSRDKDKLINKYEFTEHEAARICEQMRVYEAEKRVEEIRKRMKTLQNELDEAMKILNS